MDSAYLTDINLANANLSNANLIGAYVSSVNLTGANLTGVTWPYTTCPDGGNSDTGGDTCMNNLGQWTGAKVPIGSPMGDRIPVIDPLICFCATEKSCPR
jgi:uncharacterized protein YjbI with pentapeptide repeats